MGAQHMPLPSLPARDPKGHKGTFGTAVVVGGCARRRSVEAGGSAPGTLHMLGGACFAAMGALRAGCGLVKMLLPEPLVDHALAVAPSATAIGIPVDSDGDLIGHEAASVIDSVLGEAHCLAVGPGMGVSPGGRAAVVRAITQDRCPVVLDADGLNTLSTIRDVNLDLRAPAVLTPHPGEFRRLGAALKIAEDPSGEASRARAAESLAQRRGVVVVLKGAATVVSDGQRTWAHERANPALATAGTGDVLTGVIAGLIAQHVRLAPGPGMEPAGALGPFDAARLGVAIHARAARDWVERHRTASGLTAEDLLGLIPSAAEGFRGSDGA